MTRTKRKALLAATLTGVRRRCRGADGRVRHGQRAGGLTPREPGLSGGHDNQPLAREIRMASIRLRALVLATVAAR